MLLQLIADLLNDERTNRHKRRKESIVPVLVEASAGHETNEKKREINYEMRLRKI